MILQERRGDEALKAKNPTLLKNIEQNNGKTQQHLFRTISKKI